MNGFSRMGVAWLCLALGCAGQETVRLERIAAILGQRAQHLQQTDHELIARGLIRAERHTGVDALLLLAVIEEESRYRTRARSRRGALGLMQVRPNTAQDVCRRNRFPWDGDTSLFEPSLNILIGATYLAELRERFGAWDLALTAYNHGPTKARRAATRGRNPSSSYAGRVLNRFEAFSRPAA